MIINPILYRMIRAVIVTKILNIEGGQFAIELNLIVVKLGSPFLIKALSVRRPKP